MKHFFCITFIILLLISSGRAADNSSSSENAAANSIDIKIKGFKISKFFADNADESSTDSKNGYTITHNMFEATNEVPVMLTHKGECWNADSTIVFRTSNARLLMKADNRNNELTPIIEGKEYSFAEIEHLFHAPEGNPKLFIVADEPSGTWNTIVVWVGAFLNCNNELDSSRSSSSQSQSCNWYHSSSDSGTAFSITVDAMEKPWGGQWGEPENSGWRTVFVNDVRTSRRWFTLWDVNENALRAVVEPSVLTEWMKDSKFSGIETEDFAPGEGPQPNDKQPKWKKVVGSIQQTSIVATIMVGDKYEE